MAEPDHDALGVPLPEPDPEPEPEADRPGWLPENYDSPEAFAEAHRHLVAKLNEQGQRLNQYEQYFADQADSEPDEPAFDVGDYEEQRSSEYEAFQNDPVGMTRWIADQQQAARDQQRAREQAPLVARQQETYMAAVAKIVDDDLDREIEDYAQIAPVMHNMLQQDPTLVNITGAFEEPNPMQAVKRELVKAYKLAKADLYMENERQLREAGATQADIDRARKMYAQTLQGNSAPRENLDPSEAKLEEMRRALGGTGWSPKPA